MNVITEVEFYQKVVQISELGFTAINLRVSLLVNVVRYYYDSNKVSDINDLTCINLVSKILNFNENTAALKVLSIIIEKEYKNYPVKFIASFVRLLVTNSPSLHNTNYLGAIYIYLSLGTPLSSHKNCFGASLNHVSLWQFYVDLCAELGIKKSDGEHFQNVLSLLALIPEQSREDCVYAVSGAFFDQSPQINLLSDLLKR